MGLGSSSAYGFFGILVDSEGFLGVILNRSSSVLLHERDNLIPRDMPRESGFEVGGGFKINVVDLSEESLSLNRSLMMCDFRSLI